MQIDDLKWQLAHLGGVPPQIVNGILERGGLEQLVEAARERGDWFCAEGAVRALCVAGEFERAWGVIEPFVDTGWQPAVRVGADVLVRWGRTGQALGLADPRGRNGKVREAWPDYAEVLVGADRVDEAIDVLVPHLCDGRVLRSLVSVTEGQGRDARVLELLAQTARELRDCRTPCGGGDVWEVLHAQALVMERLGRVDEAITLLGGDMDAQRLPQNTVEFYAELLARHGRIEELGELATGVHAAGAVRPYVAALEGLGRVEDAEEHLRRLIAAAEYPTRYQGELLELLVRQGRFRAAVEAVAHTFDDLHETNLLQPAILLLAEHGRADEALKLTEERSAEFIEESGYWLPSNRWWLMGEAGRCREAIAEIAALTPDEVDDRDLTLAMLLAKDGREDEAVAQLRGCSGRSAATGLAHLLVRQGGSAEALAVIPGVAAQREEQRRLWT